MVGSMASAEQTHTPHGPGPATPPDGKRWSVREEVVCRASSLTTRKGETGGSEPHPCTHLSAHSGSAPKKRGPNPYLESNLSE